MFRNYISEKAIIHPTVSFEGNNVVLGNSEIGERTYIGLNTIVGYPSKKSLYSRSIMLKDISLLDSLSKGARIGPMCLIRSGSIIYEEVSIGSNLVTGHNVLIREGSKIGENCLIGTGTMLDGSVQIGNNVRIQSGVYLPHGTVVGDDVFIGPYACVTNDRYPVSRNLRPVAIGNGCIIGANSTLVAGVRIGESSVVAAGSVVTEDVPPKVVVVGVPARIYSSREEYEKRRMRYEYGE
ncbi:MAG: N-acetyltransferase [Crenarchaeota archaeon]|nr:N-acetyltransferase [Thermoproteota archaeon]MDW8033882.1 DapH/DapD/GlmU-related protein [Nitrososphaerota archaeon]